MPTTTASAARDARAMRTPSPLLRRGGRHREWVAPGERRDRVLPDSRPQLAADGAVEVALPGPHMYRCGDVVSRAGQVAHFLREVLDLGRGEITVHGQHAD